MAEVNRRDFLSGLGVTVGTALTALPGVLPSVGVAHAQDKPKGSIPDTPFKIGHMTFFTGAAAVLGEPMYKGQLLAAEEINAQGGLLGKRKIEILKADENAGTDANVKELRRLKLSEKIDFFCGITSSGNTPALGPVSEAWPKLGTTDFSSHITKTIAAKPDLLAISVWGGDYVAFYKQALRYGMFDKMHVASMIAFGVAPHAIGKDHPEGIIAGVHSNYHFTSPGGDKWPYNKTFVEKYHKRFSEYPNFQAEGGYTATYMLKTAIDKANHLAGGWPEDDAIISVLEGLMMAAPAGYVYIRPDKHQGYKDAITGFSKNVAEYPFPILDPNRIITIPIRNITAPPGWPKGEPTSTYTWIDKTWPQVAMAAEPAKAPAARPATPAPAKKQ